MVRKKGTVNISYEDKLLLLKIMKDIIPTDNTDWKRVTLEYNKQQKESTGAYERSLTTLKHHYVKKLATLKKPESPTANDANARLYKKVEEVETLIRRKTESSNLTAQGSEEAVSYSDNGLKFEDASSSESDNERDLTDDKTPDSEESSPPPSSLCKRSRPFSPRPSNLCKRSKPFSPPSIEQHMGSRPSNLCTSSYKENSSSTPPSIAQSICRMADAMANKLENEGRQDRKKREQTLEMFQDEFVHTTREITNEVCLL